MIVKEILTESLATKVTDPKTKKLLPIALMHDATLPFNLLSMVGKRPTEEQALNFLEQIITKSVNNSEYGDPEIINKYGPWLVRQYSNGVLNYEDINGEIDTLGKFYALSRRGWLKPEHNDLNRFPNLTKLSMVLSANYAPMLRKIADEEKLQRMKKTAKAFTIIDDDNYLAQIPLSYGACYLFNNAMGVPASYCTGSSSTHWFDSYAKDGIILQVFNKKKPNLDTSKYQIHAPSNQIKSASQSGSNSGDSKFAKNFPGLLPKILEELSLKATEFKRVAAEVGFNYNVKSQIDKIAKLMPKSMQQENSPAQTDQTAPNREVIIRTDNYDEWVDELEAVVNQLNAEGTYENWEAYGPDGVYDVAKVNNVNFAAFRHLPYPDGSPRGIINTRGQRLGIRFRTR